MRKGGERRNQILDQTALLFVAKSCGRTTRGDVMENVGIGKGKSYLCYRFRVIDALEKTLQKGLADNCAHGKWGGVRSLVARLAWGEERGK